jgi:hypothetical protein
MEQRKSWLPETGYVKEKLPKFSIGSKMERKLRRVVSPRIMLL